MNIQFVKHYKLYYLFSGLLALACVVSLFIFGLKLGIDFTGGSILEIAFETRPENTKIQEKLNSLNLGEIVIQPTENNGAILRFKSVDENTHQQILAKLGEISKIEEKRFESIGPTIGKELRQKTIILVVISLAALLFYIAVAFRKSSWLIKGWHYGLVSIITLAFDVLIPFASFSVLGKIYNIQFNIGIVAALLTILGYTINDKVIVFDRVRENLATSGSNESFSEIVNKSLNQILGRSLSTGTCTLIVLFFIFLFGGETLKYFALTLIIGIVVGTYSSLFIASSLLVSWMGKKK